MWFYSRNSPVVLALFPWRFHCALYNFSYLTKAFYGKYWCSLMEGNNVLGLCLASLFFFSDFPLPVNGNRDDVC